MAINLRKAPYPQNYEIKLIQDSIPGYEAKLAMLEDLRNETDIYMKLSKIREFIYNYSIVTLPSKMHKVLDEFYESSEHRPETFRLVSSKEKWMSAVSQVLKYLDHKAGKHKKFIGNNSITYFPTTLGDKGKKSRFPSNSDNYGRGGSDILKVLSDLGYIERIGNYCNYGGDTNKASTGAYSIPYKLTSKFMLDYYSEPVQVSTNNSYYIKQFDLTVANLTEDPDLLYEFVNQFHVDFGIDITIAAKQLLADGIGYRDLVQFDEGELNGLILDRQTAKFISDIYDMDLHVLLQVGEDSYSGRFHTKFNQIKSESRKFIQLDGEPVNEIDMKACQMSLLIAESIRVGDTSLEEGKKLLEGDLYVNIGNLVPRFNGFSRSEIKAKVMETLFATSQKDRTQAWVSELSPGVFKTLVDIKDIDRDYYNNGKHSSFLPRYLQCMEVEVIRKVRTELNRRGIRYVSVFDSFVIPKSLTMEVLDICRSIKPDFTNVAGIPTKSRRHYEIINWVPEFDAYPEP